MRSIYVVSVVFEVERNGATGSDVTEAVITATEVIASTCAAGSCGISALVGPFRRK